MLPVIYSVPEFVLLPFGCASEVHFKDNIVEEQCVSPKSSVLGHRGLLAPGRKTTIIAPYEIHSEYRVPQDCLLEEKSCRPSDGSKSSWAPSGTSASCSNLSGTPPLDLLKTFETLRSPSRRRKEIKKRLRKWLELTLPRCMKPAVRGDKGTVIANSVFYWYQPPSPAVKRFPLLK